MESAVLDSKDLTPASASGQSHGSVHHVKHQPKRQFAPEGKDKRPNFHTCYRCGQNNHTPDRCHYKNATCFNCNKTGHISRVCIGPNQAIREIAEKRIRSNHHSWSMKSQQTLIVYTRRVFTNGH